MKNRKLKDNEKISFAYGFALASYLAYLGKENSFSSNIIGKGFTFILDKVLEKISVTVDPVKASNLLDGLSDMDMNEIFRSSLHELMEQKGKNAI